ncbi:MAG TPA: PAS and helix-turn-helix domain-containing protein [Solirubrobacteraceae bacterium]|nr:PAS and helix-turn-helix domain-containing protein [Solirubrobacteraceae bacterium]
MSGRGEWAGLFASAFRQSRNAMTLVDTSRHVVDVNGAYLSLLGYTRSELVGQPVSRFVIGPPALTPVEWRAMLAQGEFDGEVQLRAADGGAVAVQWGATVEVVTGRQLVLAVALSTSRWGSRFRRARSVGPPSGSLSLREREVVRLVALGNTGPEIAGELQISHDTVRTHARNAMLKVGARSRAHLVAKALGEGLVLENPH